MADAVQTGACSVTFGGETMGLVTNMSLSASRSTIEISTVDMAKDEPKRFIGAAHFDPGEVSLDILYDAVSSDHKRLLDNLEDAATDGVQAITFVVKDSAGADQTYSFKGIVTGWEVSAALDDALKVSVTIKLTGAGAFTHAMPTSD